MVGFRIFGAPRFSVQRSQNALKEAFWDLRTENRGRPKNAKSNHDGSNPPFSAPLTFSAPKFRTEFPLFSRERRPEFGRKMDLHETLLTAMAQVLASLRNNQSKSFLTDLLNPQITNVRATGHGCPHPNACFPKSPGPDWSF